MYCLFTKLVYDIVSNKTGWEEGVITEVSSKEICRQHSAEAMHIPNLGTKRKGMDDCVVTFNCGLNISSP
jgi:hypothetical protein